MDRRIQSSGGFCKAIGVETSLQYICESKYSPRKGCDMMPCDSGKQIDLELSDRLSTSEQLFFVGSKEESCIAGLKVGNGDNSQSILLWTLPERLISGCKNSACWPYEQ